MTSRPAEFFRSFLFSFEETGTGAHTFEVVCLERSLEQKGIIRGNWEDAVFSDLLGPDVLCLQR